MEPLGWDVLASFVPENVQSVWDQVEVKRKPAEWAFKYLWNYPEIDIALRSMSTLDQLKENIEYASQGYPDSLSEDEKFLIKESGSAYRENKGVDCTECGYCMPYPEGVNIPDCFMQYNYATMLNDPENGRMHYMTILKNDEKASRYIEYDECEMIFQQMTDIKEKLKEVVRAFGR